MTFYGNDSDDNGMADDGFGNMFGGGGGGAPAISWDEKPIGTKFRGILVKNERTQQTDFDTKRPSFWDDVEQKITTVDTGRPMMQDEVTLLTDFTNYELMSDNASTRKRTFSEPDDGTRRWFVKGGKNGVKKLFTDAVNATGARSPQKGGIVEVTLVKRTKQPKANYFEVSYTRPTAESLARLAAWEDGGSVLVGANAASAAKGKAVPSQTDTPPF